jgi:phenylpropionate dioxygenase-like ring-hydroxylating dioxygenase large terminal subunit
MVAIIKGRGDLSLRSLIDTEEGTVSRELYTNPDIFEQELEQIYQRCWLFLGHESQLPNPGDFIVSRMGTEEVLVMRDRKDKQIRAFLNSCAHRGMKVCRYDQGNALLFTCPFHAWTYDTQGKLVGAAYHNSPQSYAGELDMKRWGLYEVAQFKNYYGTLWATWDPKAPSFEDYVGPFAESIRYDCESSSGEDGALEVFTPFQKWRLPTNWKVPAFTSATDLTHAAMTHRSVNAAAIGPQRNMGGQGERHGRRGQGPRSERYAVGDHNLGHGGNWTKYLEPGIADYVDTWYEEGVDDWFRQAHAKKAVKYADKIQPPDGHGGGHFCVFPNFIMDDWRWRWWHPQAVGMVERWSLFGIDNDAPKFVKDAVRHYVQRYNGPSGATESDDMENWNYVYTASLGANARKHNYYFANGLGRGVESDEHPGLVFNGTHTEEAHRARFSRWLAFMEANSWDDLYPINKQARHRIW